VKPSLLLLAGLYLLRRRRPLWSALLKLRDLHPAEPAVAAR